MNLSLRPTRKAIAKITLSDWLRSQKGERVGMSAVPVSSRRKKWLLNRGDKFIAQNSIPSAQCIRQYNRIEQFKSGPPQKAFKGGIFALISDNRSGMRDEPLRLMKVYRETSAKVRHHR
jgi:hypothetical protein